MTPLDLLGPPDPRRMPCAYPGCGGLGLLNHEMCETHRDRHRWRNAKWKRARKWVREQLGLML